MKTALLIAIGATLLFGVGLIHTEGPPNPDDRPNLAANSNVAAASARQQIQPPSFVAVATTPAMLLGLLVSAAAGLIALDHRFGGRRKATKTRPDFMSLQADNIGPFAASHHVRGPAATEERMRGLVNSQVRRRSIKLNAILSTFTSHRN